MASKRKPKPAKSRGPAAVSMPRMTRQEREEQARYQAQSDLRSLETAQQIRNDPARLKRAQTEARRMASVAGVSGVGALARGRKR